MDTSSKRARPAITIEEPCPVKNPDPLEKLTMMVEAKFNKMEASQSDILSELKKAASEREEIKMNMSDICKSLQFVQNEMDDIKEARKKDQSQLEKKLKAYELRMDQLEQRDRGRSLRWHGIELTKEEERDNTILAQRIYNELYLPAVGCSDTQANKLDWRCAIEWAHKVPHKPSAANKSAPGYHVIFKCTTRYVLNTIYKNRKTILSKFNTKQGRPSCFLQLDCTAQIREAMQYLRGCSEVNPARVYLNTSGQICFHRHGASADARPEVCKNYLLRPVAEMLN